ncbi:RND family efflux transporter, MFP subunit [Thiohalospira halophila DSM 15071]|uniref:RND family efflux transporter, MFP subunit n=1 Tax=Thiohalospira halophila DSM 15071 TaxID=1123397 RepID=A0A1I1VHU6_9GAMM|nr:efflux RND transporter periplasmic adaptor subunit [Thiohalospira halophila]SFD80633.1 RND family efflux transporter, MFP subunit [Thiohalospira halophila DSM 15071]
MALRAGRWAGVIVGLAAGGILAVWLIAAGPSPDRNADAGPPPALSVIEVQPVDFRAVARGHGTVRAAQTWRATASVAGRIVERHPELASGNILPAGTRLLAQDPTRYRLAIQEAEAELASIRAEERQLERETESLRKQLAMERERLALTERELERIREAADAGNIARSEQDRQLGTTVARRQAVAQLENELALLPGRRQGLQARRDQAQARLERAREDLADTRFEAPFDLRISEVAVERHDHATPGQLIFRADSIENAEVEAHLPLARLRPLAARILDSGGGALDLRQLRERTPLEALDARIALAGDNAVHWKGRVTRVASGLDPATRTVRVVITVDEPYANARPPDRPALQPGTYVRVRLGTPGAEPRLVVPATAVHDGAVYLADGDDRLRRRPVTVAFEQDDLAVITDGLAAGDRVIVDDPVPAVDGMAIAPQRDEGLEAEIRRRAGGTEG